MVLPANDGARMIEDAEHLGDILLDEMFARRWNPQDVAERMGGDVRHNRLVVDTILIVRSRNMRIGRPTAERLAAAFDVSAEFLLNLDEAWQRSLPRKMTAADLGLEG
jgi:plasmid maintenance system antidote protein VapI